jgi:hypothetical protein
MSLTAFEVIATASAPQVPPIQRPRRIPDTGPAPEHRDGDRSERSDDESYRRGDRSLMTAHKDSPQTRVRKRAHGVSMAQPISAVISSRSANGPSDQVLCVVDMSSTQGSLPRTPVQSSRIRGVHDRPRACCGGAPSW